MKIGAVGVVLVLVFAVVCAGCKTKQTTTKKRSFDPLLDKFASNFEVGEEGWMVSGERSEYEAREVQNIGNMGTKRFEAPSKKGRGFGGANRFEAGRYQGADGQAFGGAVPTIRPTESALSGQEARAAGMAPIERGAYDTGTDAVSGAMYRTGPDREVTRRRQTYPEPLIIDSGQEPMTVGEVKQLLEKN
ncbi:MAG: hypothetical protein AAF591_02380 [Verrucomicrobiota bacterium]